MNRVYFILNILVLIIYVSFFAIFDVSIYHNFITYIVTIFAVGHLINVTLLRLDYLKISKIYIVNLILPLINIIFLLYLIFKSNSNE